MWSTVLTFVIAAVSTVTAMPSKRQGDGVVFSCTVPNTAAITFDDGPYQWQREIVDLLDSRNAKGTFFVNGNNYGCIYDYASELQNTYSRGHQVASHSWAHRNLAELSADEVGSELDRVDEALKKIIGARPTMMRPPYGSYNPTVVSAAAARGEAVIIWDFDSGDSAGVSPGESNARYDEVAGRRPSTILTLNHETYEGTVREVLPHALDVLQGAGYNLVTVAECLGVDAYTDVGPFGQPDGSWQC